MKKIGFITLFIVLSMMVMADTIKFSPTKREARILNDSFILQIIEINCKEIVKKTQTEEIKIDSTINVSITKIVENLFFGGKEKYYLKDTAVTNKFCYALSSVPLPDSITRIHTFLYFFDQERHDRRELIKSGDQIIYHKLGVCYISTPEKRNLLGAGSILMMIVIGTLAYFYKKAVKNYKIGNTGMSLIVLAMCLFGHFVYPELFSILEAIAITVIISIPNLIITFLVRDKV